MAKFQVLPVLAVLFLAAAGFLSAEAKTETFVIEGRVYCDNCRAGFETTITEYIEGAEVNLVCKNETTNKILDSAKGMTDKTGTYSLSITHDHEEQVCEVFLVKSPVADCADIKIGREKTRVTITNNSGMSSNVRKANSLGFLRKEPLPICGKLLAEYALGDD